MRNVLVRWRATIATVLGIALVVAVYVLMLSLAAGLEKSSSNTGSTNNVLIVRKGSTAESSSQVTREQFKLIQYLPEISRDEKNLPLVSADVLVLINLPRKGTNGEANVLVRGISPLGIKLRPQVTMASGRWFKPGKREVVVPRRLAARFANFEVGDQFTTGSHVLTVTGWTDGKGSAFDSEIWMDADETRSIFTRDNYSSVLVGVSDPKSAVALMARIESDQRLPLRALIESDYYKSQTLTAMPIKILGRFLATAMSIGAIFAAMNTMYASVGARTREVGTLRVLGFRRRAILLGFLVEGAFLSLIGGILGCAISLPLNGHATGTIDFQSFSEVVFQFRITPQLAGQGVIFALLVGVAGSLLPAWRASRLPVITALKSL